MIEDWPQDIGVSQVLKASMRTGRHLDAIMFEINRYFRSSPNGYFTFYYLRSRIMAF